VSAPPAPPLLLASTSPQRRAILQQLGLPFDLVAPRYVEHDPPEADATDLVCDHARGKAESVAAEADGRPVLGVDTTVVLGGRDLREAGRRGAMPSGCSGSVRADACRSCPGSLADAAWEVCAEGGGDARHVPALDAARPRRVRRGR
jgi:hypothetical protein